MTTAADTARPAAAAPPADGGGIALWRLGFRPFYLLASLYAAIAIPCWVLEYRGLLPPPLLGGPAGHAHEMLFGFALAVITGFLFTAVRNWTARPTPTGALLAAFAVLWLAGRGLAHTPWLWASLTVNAAFPLAVAAAIAVPLARSRNTRNYGFPLLLAGLAIATVAVHLAVLGRLPVPPGAGLQAGLDIVLFVMTLVAGRVVPMFTNNGVPGAGATRHPGLERAALSAILALLAADVAGASAAVLGPLLAAAAIAHAARLALWRPWRTRRVPLVWVLHLAYAWIVVHLVLRALAAAGALPAPLAVHALTIGAIGGMTIGMMTRTARGHTARPLVADRGEIACYALIALAALVRVAGPIALPGAYAATVVVAAGAWSAAWTLYAIRYWPVLTRPRLDGAPG